VSYLRSVRQHAGFMVPGPVQAAVALAYNDDEHVSSSARATSLASSCSRKR
jgi:aspartate/methionine/tyrosine aminotransferase